MFGIAKAISGLSQLGGFLRLRPVNRQENAGNMAANHSLSRRRSRTWQTSSVQFVTTTCASFPQESSENACDEIKASIIPYSHTKMIFRVSLPRCNLIADLLTSL